MLFAYGDSVCREKGSWERLEKKGGYRLAVVVFDLPLLCDNCATSISPPPSTHTA